MTARYRPGKPNDLPASLEVRLNSTGRYHERLEGKLKLGSSDWSLDNLSDQGTQDSDPRRVNRYKFNLKQHSKQNQRKKRPRGIMARPRNHNQQPLAQHLISDSDHRRCQRYEGADDDLPSLPQDVDFGSYDGNLQTRYQQNHDQQFHSRFRESFPRDEKPLDINTMLILQEQNRRLMQNRKHWYKDENGLILWNI